MWSWFGPPCLLRVVIVNLKSDGNAAIRGVLWQSRGPWLVLRDASMLQAGSGSPPPPLDGDIVIHRDNVSFLQVVP
jgi:hypothetical protein